MLAVLVEINGLYQLNKLDPRTAPALHRRFLDYLGQGGGQTESQIFQNFLYFQADASERGNRQFWDGVREIFDYLYSTKEEYQGFLILADRLKRQSPGDGFAAMRKSCYSLRKTDCLLITPRAEELCGRYFQLRRDDGYFLLENREEMIIPGAYGEGGLYIRQRLIERCLPYLIPEIGDEPAENRVLYFYGQDGIGKFSNIREGIRRLRERTISGAMERPRETPELREPGELPEVGIPASPEVLPVIHGVEGLKSSFQEILKSVDPDFARIVPEYLDAAEKEAWASRTFFLSQGATEQGLEDLFLFYRLYIKAYIRACREALHPAFLICRNPEYINHDSLEVMLKIFEEFLSQGVLVPVLISQERNPQDNWNGIPCQTIRVAPLSLAEVDAFLASSGLEGSDTEALRNQTRGHILYLFHYITLRSNGLKVPERLTGPEISCYFLRQLDPSLQKVLYAVSLFPGLTDENHWAELLTGNSVVFQSSLPLLRKLKLLGFFSQEQWLRPSLDDLQRAVNLEGGEKERIRSIMVRAVNALWIDRGSFSIYSFLQGIREHRGQTDFCRQFFDYVSGILEQGQTSKAEALIDAFGSLFTLGPAHSLESVVCNSLALRSALLQGNREMARIRFLSFNEIPEAPLSFPEALVNLETSRYYYALSEYRKALDTAKKALLVFQDEGNKFLNADTNSQIGLVMMGMGRLNEAAMYFAMCREQLSFEQLPHNYIKTLALEGLGQFILGNFSRAAELFEETEEKAVRFGRRDWQSYALFLLGRISFELGRYEAAKETFLQCLLQGRLYFRDDRMKVFRAWIARCFAYQQKPQEALKILETLKPDGEVLFFTAEAFNFTGDRKKALDALDIILDKQLLQGPDFFPGEYIYWKTGFSSVEDRAIGSREGNTVLLNLIRVFRGYLLGQGEDKTEGLQELSRITREGRIDEEDPYRHFYYYLYNCVVPEMGDGENLNKLTILSRAAKYLQHRASRISETRDKQDFLNKNHWNGLLLRISREEKII